MCKQILSTILSVCMVISTAGWGMVEAAVPIPAPQASASDQQPMDKLLAPIALYPDALLAQVLACAGSPQQVTEVNQWLEKNSQLKGSELQEAAETDGFDASFIALVLFPDVLTFLEQNLEWTTELGKAFTSDQKAVLDSVQRLRTQAKDAGNLKTTAQQEVTTETQNGQTVIVVQPANPQVVYVPQYNPQTVYAAPPPEEDNSGETIAAALIGFGLGIALGAAINNSYGYYGYSSWGCHWHSHAVVVRGGHYHAPHGRYGYAQPVAGYRPNVNVNAPRYNNINVDRSNTDVNRQRMSTQTQTPRPTTTSATSARTQRPTTSTVQDRSGQAGNASRGRAQTASAGTASPARQMERGSNTSAFSGYQKGSREKTASSRGRSSSRSQSGRSRGSQSGRSRRR